MRTMKRLTYARVATLALVVGMIAGPFLGHVGAQSNQIVSTGAGTITTSKPFAGAQTWNAGGVSFVGLQLTFTETASAAGSNYFSILGGAAGTTPEFTIGKGGTVTAAGALSTTTGIHTATTNQLLLGTTNVTTFSAPAPASSLTVTLPNIAGSVGTAFDCGSTGSGSQTCSPAAASGNYHMYSGRSTLSSNAATITFPVAFGSSSTFTCVANDVTTRANPVQMVPASGTTATITNTTGASDVIQWWCGGI